MSRLRRHREAAGLTQVGLAQRSGVSRQLIGAAETGRHLPRVDAAIALADALGVDVASLFAPETSAADVVTGGLPKSGSSVLVGWVGDSAVTAPARVGPDGWDVADGIVIDDRLNVFEQVPAGLVVAGCEPGLEVVERILREHRMAGVAATASSAAAIEALEAGRVHAAVVHGADVDERAAGTDLEIVRFALTRWRVGLAAPVDSSPGWAERALSGTISVVQREAGAGVQRTFEDRVKGHSPVPGPRVSSHFQAAGRAVLTGLPAVTIEPAALAAGADFHPLETHDAQLWVDKSWANESVVGAALDVISGRRFQSRLQAVGGYDLTGCGTRVS